MALKSQMDGGKQVDVEIICEEIMIENFPDLVKVINSQSKEVINPSQNKILKICLDTS